MASLVRSLRQINRVESLTWVQQGGGQAQWGSNAFTGPTGGAPGLPAAQTRTNGGPASSFAQAMGNTQPHTPLNLE